MGRNDKFTDDNILNVNHGNGNHGLSKTRFYRIWMAMKQRCLTPHNPAYKNYGGRGISICNEWLEFKKFKADMYDSYVNHLEKFGKINTTIDRINVNGNYEPSNCTWSTRKQQQLNRRPVDIASRRKPPPRGKKYEYNGEFLNLRDMAARFNIKLNILDSRIRVSGWAVEKAITEPVRRTGRPKKVIIT